MAKKHISLWIDEDILKKSDANIKIAKLKNRSEFIEAAIDFYNGYLHNQVNESFIGKTLMNTFQSTDVQAGSGNCEGVLACGSRT